MSADLAIRAGVALQSVRTRTPRVHCLMNTVVQKLVADGLSAIGAIPSMTSSVEEVADFAAKADALVVNLGTLDAARRQAISIAVAAAGEGGKPWALDPAHCDYSPPRAAFARELIARSPSAVRTNEAEFDLLAVPDRVVGVRTGRVDVVAGAGHTLAIENGHPLMARVTGTGCLSGAVIAAFLAVETDPFIASAAATLVMGVAAEIAAERAAGPGSFEPAFLDALHGLQADDIVQRARVRHDKG